jgi:hypothetical protein
VRVAARAPGTLVLGESFNRGWRASCGGRSLGQPRVIDGYANAWDVGPSCTNVSFAFAPDRPVHRLQLLSGLACLLLLGLVVVPRRRRRRAAESLAASAAVPLPDPPPTRTPLRRALALGLLAGAVIGFCFALRAGPAVFAAVTLIVWLGIGPRLLMLAAGALLAVVVPALYVLFPADDRGGYNPGYAGEHIAAHWVAVAAFTLLAVALVQTLSTATRRDAGAARSAA